MMRIANAINIILTITVSIVAILFARRNLLRGQGDKRGATILSVAVFVSLLIATLLRANHPTSFQAKLVMLWLLASEATLLGAMIWLTYIAAEPFVRRRWPEMLISWSRLIAGRWHDPMIGRDVLIGDLGLGTMVSRGTFTLTGAVIAVTLLIRFGLLATCAYAYAFLVLCWLAVTLDTSSWFFGRSLLLIATLLGLAIFGFIVSLGHKPLFPRAIFED